MEDSLEMTDMAFDVVELYEQFKGVGPETTADEEKEEA